MDLTPAALARRIADATTEQMTELGVGADALRELGLSFVVTRTLIEVNRLPKTGEQTTLLSWAGRERHWMYPRYTVIFSSDGEKLVSACSQWVLIDTKARSLAPPHEILNAIPILKPDDEPRPPALTQKFPPELPMLAEHTVQDSEIDVNGHVNNSHYLVWATELLGEEYLQEHRFSSVWVEYMRELYAGQHVCLNYVRENESLYVRGYIDGELSFSLKMEFTTLKG